ncbi:MAG: acyloxyacyl hydrolase [Parachlamydiaceae bacterium]|nr:MAG: acyloxyacyl hydrolase [Parachlamydiaceae bacterium]
MIGGGYLDSRKCTGSIFQAEYRFGKYFWRYIRPQIDFLISQHGSGFIGAGIGLEFYVTRNILLIPSFVPGVYWRGKGKDLGCPIEFRSCLELAYEMENQVRLGVQIYHLSNAHLSCDNPGFNAISFCLSLPLKS